MNYSTLRHWAAWLVSGMLVALALGSCAAPSASPSAEKAAATGRITILYDAFGKTSAMKKDWGFAALVEVNGKRILFDTGDNPEIFAQNVEAQHVDLTTLDFVVTSHRHGDHMGGLTYLLSMNPKIKIYAPKESFGVYGASLPSSFYRKAEAIVAEAAKINPHVHLIAGGFHLVVAQDPVIEKVAAALHDTWKVDYVAPGHRTGEPTFAALKQAFGAKYLYAGLGTSVGLGADSLAESGRSGNFALDEGDLSSYRLLALRELSEEPEWRLAVLPVLKLNDRNLAKGSKTPRKTVRSCFDTTSASSGLSASLAIC